MTIFRRIFFAAAGLTAVFLTCLGPAAWSGQAPISTEPDAPVLHVESFNFDPSVPLEDRIGAPPPFLLEWLKDADQMPTYKAYTVSPEEKKKVAAALAALPPKMKKVFKARLVGIYFVENLIGNGMSNVLLGPDGKNYAWTAINPTGLSRTVSQILSVKEDSLFKKHGTVSVDCGAPLPGVFYTLAHEATHDYNYIKGLTPYVNPYWYQVFNGTTPPANSPWDVWAGFDRPEKRFDFARRDELLFGAPEGEGNFEAADAVKLYSALRNSPFMSLYGSKNWSEDIAELVAYSFLKRETGHPCVVKYPGPAGVLNYTPGKRAALRAERLYRSLSR